MGPFIKLPVNGGATTDDWEYLQPGVHFHFRTDSCKVLYTIPIIQSREREREPLDVRERAR